MTKRISIWFIGMFFALGLQFQSGFSQETNDTKEIQNPKIIIGSAREDVNLLLKGWTIRESNRSTTFRPIVYYTKDVDVIVSFQNGKAIGVAVIDKPGSGISPIPQKRFDELIALIGRGQPKSADISRDVSGIREFSVGDAD